MARDPSRYRTGTRTNHVLIKREGYQGDLARLHYSPERPFETLIADEQVLVSGIIDLVQVDDPPRVTIVDFKSGDGEDRELNGHLDVDEVALQVSLYGLAARRELEYEPEKGLVRYLGAGAGEARELHVELDEAALERARRTVVEAAGAIRRREWTAGPHRTPRRRENTSRCAECDFGEFCGMEAAVRQRSVRAQRRAVPAT